MNKKNINIFTLRDPLLEPYYLQYDSNGFTVFKTVAAGDTGREREQTVGYYGSLDSSLTGIAKDAVQSQGFNTVQEFVQGYIIKLKEIKSITQLPV
jgi:hypothetical protein